MEEPLIFWSVLAAVLLLYVASLVWVWRDARRLGHDPRLAVLFVGLLWWPLGFFFWLFVRRPKALAPPGYGSAWG